MVKYATRFRLNLFHFLQEQFIFTFPLKVGDMNNKREGLGKKVLENGAKI